MKVLILNGSARANGCTARALKELENTLHKEGIETETILIGNKDVRGCIACRTCANTGKCVFDDIVNEIAPKFEESDGIVIGTPVYFAGASGNMISLLDRLFFSTHFDKSMKVGASVISSRRAGSTSAYDEINKYFAMNNMPIVTSQYWNQVHGTNPEEVRKDEEGMQTMRTLANNMAWILKCIDVAKKAGVEYPEKEKQIKTNFIR